MNPSIGFIERAALQIDLLGIIEFVLEYEKNIKENNNEFRVLRETGTLGPTQLALMKLSFFELRLKATHIQTKPIPMSTDNSVLQYCEVVT